VCYEYSVLAQPDGGASGRTAWVVAVVVPCLFAPIWFLTAGPDHFFLGMVGLIVAIFADLVLLAWAAWVEPVSDTA